MSRWQFLLCKRSARSTPKCLPNKVLGENVQRSEKISNMHVAQHVRSLIYIIYIHIFVAGTCVACVACSERQWQ